MSTESACVVIQKNLDVTECIKMPGLVKGMITTPDNFECTPAQAVDPAFWQAALLAASGVRIFLWPEFVSFKDVSDKSNYETTPLADMAVRDGKYKFDIAIRKDLCLHKKMYTHRSNSGRVILIDTANQYIMTEKSNGKFAGIKKSLLNTEKMQFNDGTVASKSPLHLVLADNLELDQNGVLLDANSFINDLVALSDVTLTVSGVLIRSFIVKVSAACDQTPVVGLLSADFKVTKDSDGTAIAQTCVDNGDGTYTLSFVADLVPSHVNLRSAALLTVPGFESTGGVVAHT